MSLYLPAAIQKSCAPFFLPPFPLQPPLTRVMQIVCVRCCRPVLCSGIVPEDSFRASCLEQAADASHDLPSVSGHCWGHTAQQGCLRTEILLCIAELSILCAEALLGCCINRLFHVKHPPVTLL